MKLHHFLGLPLGLLAMAGISDTAAAQVQTGLGGAPTLTFRGPRMGFVQASATTRTVGVGQFCPFIVAMPPIPPGATEVASFASWNYMLDGPSPPANVMGINANPVIGGLVGEGDPDLNAGKDRGASYMADITGLVLTGNNNVISGICDGALGIDPVAFGEGVTLITIFQFPNGPDHEVDLWAGYTSTESNATGDALATIDFTTEYRFNTAKFFVNAVDGELGPGDQFAVNGMQALGVLAGLNGAGNVWVGLLGPNPFNNLYDAAVGDVSSFLVSGDTSLSFRTFNATDSIAHTLVAMSHQVECGGVTVYCTAKVNSLGCTPQISTLGNPHETGGGQFRIRASNVINNKNGILFYGFGAAANPFQGGTLCVQAPFERTPVQNSGGNAPPNDCSGTYSIDFNAWIQSGIDPQLVAGESVFAQYWSRDPLDAFTTGLTDAVAFDICP